jgi:cytochrome bd-type quinol oxidase subunit 2
METMFWLVLLGVFVAGYLALEGADFGAAMVLPLLGRDDRRGRDGVVAAIAPLFLGNEVWLVAAIGVAEGAFPAAEGALLSRLYPVFLVVLGAWSLRDAGLWFRRHGDDVWRWRWDCAIGVASLLLAGGWGVLLGDIVFGGTIGVGAVLCGVVLVGCCLLRGTTFLAVRLPGSARIRRIGRVASLPTAGLVVLTGVAGVAVPRAGRGWPLWLLGALLLVAVLSTWPRMSARVRSWVLGCALASAGPLVALSAFRSVTTDSATLSVLTPFVIGALPVLAACQVGLRWLCRGPVDAGNWSYF